MPSRQQLGGTGVSVCSPAYHTAMGVAAPAACMAQRICQLMGASLQSTAGLGAWDCSSAVKEHAPPLPVGNRVT